MSGSVLIETYWNVKADNTGLRPAFCSINRNILECKDTCYQIYIIFCLMY